MEAVKSSGLGPLIMTQREEDKVRTEHRAARRRVTLPSDAAAGAPAGPRDPLDTDRARARGPADSARTHSDGAPGLGTRELRLRATRAGPPSGEPLKQKPTLPSLKATGGHQPFSELSLEDESWKAHLGVVFKTLFEHTDQFYLSHTR